MRWQRVPLRRQRLLVDGVDAPAVDAQPAARLLLPAAEEEAGVAGCWSKACR